MSYSITIGYCSRTYDFIHTTLPLPSPPPRRPLQKNPHADSKIIFIFFPFDIMPTEFHFQSFVSVHTSSSSILFYNHFVCYSFRRGENMSHSAVFLLSISREDINTEWISHALLRIIQQAIDNPHKRLSWSTGISLALEKSMRYDIEREKRTRGDERHEEGNICILTCDSKDMHKFMRFSRHRRIPIEENNQTKQTVTEFIGIYCV